MEVKLLLNANIDALPEAIKKEFIEIRLKFIGGSNKTAYLSETFYTLAKKQSKGLLLENEEDEEIQVKLTNEKYISYLKQYHQGFRDGYVDFNAFLNDSVFNDADNRVRVNKVFAGLHNKIYHLSEFMKDDFLCIDLHFYEHGYEVGSFIRCWDIVLNNFNLFKDIFEFHYSAAEQSISKKQKTSWFQVGLRFADGTVQRLSKEQNSGREIARILGNKNYAAYITETLGNQTVHDKNIYSSFKNMKTIYDYCIENGIEVCDEFISRYNANKRY